MSGTTLDELLEGIAKLYRDESFLRLERAIVTHFSRVATRRSKPLLTQHDAVFAAQCVCVLLEHVKSLNKKRPKCGKCGVTGVRIYRQYGMFRREETDRCNECLDPANRGYMVPCILSINGDAWGYGSVPDAECEAFYALPEKSNQHPSWRKYGGWPSEDASQPHAEPIQNDQQNEDG